MSNLENYMKRQAIFCEQNDRKRFVFEEGAYLLLF